MSDKKALYIHIPFCKKKCIYCDFNSCDDKGSLIEKYIECLKVEMKSFRGSLIDTIYFGGGTPSVLNEKFIEKIFRNIKKIFEFSEDLEATFEINPDTISQFKLEVLKEFGVTRISMGCQSTDNSILLEMGRTYDYECFLNAHNLIKQHDFNNINFDLIMGWPTQTTNDYKSSLQKLIKLAPKHISVYGLTVADGTILAKKILSKEFENISDDKQADLFEYTIDFLEQNGFSHYEISNFAKPGFESRHNQYYWLGKEYIGLGAGASSYIDGKRYQNTPDIEEYCKCESIPREIDNVDAKSKLAETIFLSLRLLKKGINRSEFLNNFGCDIFEIFNDKIKFLIDNNLLKFVNEEQLVLTRQGVLKSNLVFQEFF
ncbi:radical SAM family heme chaperone HemW [bacterium]